MRAKSKKLYFCNADTTDIQFGVREQFISKEEN